MGCFEFNDYDEITDGEIKVVVRERRPAKPEIGYVPAYRFDILLPDNPEPIGQIELRVGNTRHIIMYAGHLGYRINEEYRGQRYAAKACNLIKRIALDHDLDTLWITCNPDNYASRRTCEIMGAKFVEIVYLPEDTDMYQSGERQKCRYRWNLLK